jgi:cytochrome o ubiquinol oxidase operon protein cyoD
MHNRSLPEIQKEWHGSLKAYAIGLLLCLGLTGASFALVTEKVLKGHELLVALISLAVVQATVQLIFFLHVGKEETKPRWASLSFAFMFITLLAIVIGSLWVMHDLNMRMMPAMDMSSGHHMDMPGMNMHMNH